MLTTDQIFAGRIRMSPAVHAKLQAHHLAAGKRVESCSFVLGHAHVSADGQRTIVLSDPEVVFLFAPDCFVSKGYGHVSLDKDIKAQIFLRAVQDGYTAVVDVHDHHFTSDAWFSGTDDRDDNANAQYVADTVQKFMPAGKQLSAAAMLITKGSWAARFMDTATLPSPAFRTLRVDRVGTQMDCLSSLDLLPAQACDARHIGIISARHRDLMRHLAVTLVGAGGTGSIALEGLLRSGFRNISVIDADRVEATNLNRLQGAGPADVGRLKVDVLADIAARIAPDANIRRVNSMVFGEAAVAALRASDLIIGCVDNRETRWWLNRFCVQYMVPWFDCSVMLHATPSVRHEIRSGAVLPATFCCGHCGPVEFFPRKTPTQFLDEVSLTVQRAAGYVQDAPDEATPSAYFVNLQSVGLMLEEVMGWVCGWREPAASTYRSSREGATQRIHSGMTNLAIDPDCPVCTTLLGRCDEEVLPQCAKPVDLAASNFEVSA